MFVHPVYYQELNTLIIDLNSSKSAGLDNSGPIPNLWNQYLVIFVHPYCTFLTWLLMESFQIS